VIVVLASRHDAAARQLAERWEPHGGRLLTCEDLSGPGWRCRLSDTQGSRAVIGGRPAGIGDIRGVVTRLPWVTEAELPQIVPSDRAYVAAEMSAFLTFWLSELACPMLNRPGEGSLSGPCWRREQWVVHAARAGLNIRSERRHLSPEAPLPPPPTAGNVVTVVGERCLGNAHESLQQRSRQLARLANVDLLAVHLSGPEPDAAFLNASIYPDIGDDDVGAAMLHYFKQR